ncbi:MAG: ABC transporter ATP-binding protein [Endomicrobium sp.]|jgi:lipoprotein-releasing system ATP-binding protein|nr:ABC transporter ATP-binding protein [Endomicrobium sp.]
MNIKTKNLVKSYDKKKSHGIEVLKNINFEIKSKEKVALIGPSGAGKSTLVHILGLMDRPTSGKVYLDSVDCFAGDSSYLCNLRKKKIGFLFQFHYLMPDFTVLENILLPVWKEKNIKFREAQNSLRKIGLLHRQDHFPNELSGGEQQRVALVRALINNPKVIFADEPTGNLDRVTGLEVESLLFEASLELGSTLVLVTHNYELASKTDRVIKMVDGNIVKSFHKENL